jgi:hypothetical protein
MNSAAQGQFEPSWLTSLSSLNRVASIYRYAVPIGVFYAKNMMSEKSLFRYFICCDSPLNELQSVFFQFFQFSSLDHEIEFLGKSFVELSSQTFRNIFSNQPITFKQQKVSASMQFDYCEFFIDDKRRDTEIRVELATSPNISHLQNKVSDCQSGANDILHLAQC